MKKLISLVLVCCIAFLNNSPVLAETTVDFQDNGKIVKQKLIKSDGEEVIEYYNNIDLFDSSNVVTKEGSGIYKYNSYGAITEKAILASTINYSSSLTGAHNNYTLAIARSEASEGIDYMWVNLSAWYAQGGYLGNDTVSNPSGTKAMIMSANINVPVNPFDYQIGSASSQHVYQNSGYEDISRTLSWTR